MKVYKPHHLDEISHSFSYNRIGRCYSLVSSHIEAGVHFIDCQTIVKSLSNLPFPNGNKLFLSLVVIVVQYSTNYWRALLS